MQILKQGVNQSENESQNRLLYENKALKVINTTAEMILINQNYCGELFGLN